MYWSTYTVSGDSTTGATRELATNELRQQHQVSCGSVAGTEGSVDRVVATVRRERVRPRRNIVVIIFLLVSLFFPLDYLLFLSPVRLARRPNRGNNVGGDPPAVRACDVFIASGFGTSTPRQP